MQNHANGRHDVSLLHGVFNGKLASFIDPYRVKNGRKDSRKMERGIEFHFAFWTTRYADMRLHPVVGQGL